MSAVLGCPLRAPRGRLRVPWHARGAVAPFSYLCVRCCGCINRRVAYLHGRVAACAVRPVWLPLEAPAPPFRGRAGPGLSGGLLGPLPLSGSCRVSPRGAMGPAPAPPLSGPGLSLRSAQRFFFLSAGAWCCGSHSCGFPHVRSLTWFAPHPCAPSARWRGSLSIMRGPERPGPLHPLGRRLGRGDFLGGAHCRPPGPPASVFHGIDGLAPVK